MYTICLRQTCHRALCMGTVGRSFGRLFWHPRVVLVPSGLILESFWCPWGVFWRPCAPRGGRIENIAEKLVRGAAQGTQNPSKFKEVWR